MAKVISFNDAVTAKLSGLMTGNAYDAGKVNKLSKSIEGRGKTLDIDIHSAAVAALALSDMHRDANSMKLLLNAMPKGSRRETLAAWVAAFGNIIVSKDKDKLFQCKMLPVEDCLPVDLAKAKATPFWDAKEKVDAGAFNDLAACKMLESFLKRAKGKTSDLSPAMQELVTKLSVEVTALSPDKVEPTPANPAPTQDDVLNLVEA